ncbi:MAG: hypothetical protein PVSMB7_22690 [Chloroflexota bacterium]
MRKVRPLVRSRLLRLLLSLSILCFALVSLVSVRTLAQGRLHAVVPETSALHFQDPTSMASDQQGNLYVFDRGMGSIQKISPAGHFLAMWAVQTAHTFPGPGRLSVDGAGNVYVLMGNSRHGNVSTGSIAKLSPQGVLLARWYSPSLLNAEFLGAGAAGTVFVIVPGQTKAGNPTGRVLKLSSTGAVVDSWHLSTAGHDFMTPVGIALDVRGSVYVSGIAGRCNRGCQGRDADLIETHSSTSGTAASRWRTWSYGAGQVVFGSGLEVNRNGTIFVAGDTRVAKISPSGKMIARWGGTVGCSPLQFRAITSLALDGHGDLYVLDEGNKNVQKISAGGQSIAIWGGCPSTALPTPRPSRTS